MKIAYFPLRSSVELFKDPTSPQPVSRAKHTGILYDTVVFEVGLFEQTIGKTGASGTYVPPGMADDERRQRARIVHEVGSTFQVAIGAQSAFGVPAPPETMRTIINTEIATTYAAPWHAGVIDELEALKPNWAAPIDSNQLLAEDRSVLKDEERKLRWSLQQSVDAAATHSTEAFSSTRSVGTPRFLRRCGSSCASDEPLRAVATRPARHDSRSSGPALPQRRGARHRSAPLGKRSVSFANTPVARRREADSETPKSVSLPETISDPTAFALRVGQEISADLFAAMVEIEGSLPKKLVKDSVNAGISLIPFVGSFASGVSAAETLAEAAKRRRTWHAALMKLRKSTEVR